MSFKDLVHDDIKSVFLNLEEFGEPRTLIFDDMTFENIQVVITGIKQKDRGAAVSDHGQGLYLATSTLHCSLDDLNGHQPEKGTVLKINDAGSDFFRSFYVGQSDCEMGMVRCELETINE